MKKGTSFLVIVIFIFIMMFVQGCKKSTVPELTTVEVTEVSLNTAVSGGDIISDGNEDITAKGVCWNTAGEPVITTDSKTSDGKGSGSFTSNLSGLVKGTVYYVRAYATNSVGTTYGEEIIFSTQIDDLEGNKYNTAPIGSQVWMAENLKATKYNDNTQIPNVTGATAWIGLTTHAYCWYDNDATINKPLYGAIYNWYAVNSGKLCPSGWHVATDADYGTMEITLGMPQAEVSEWEWRGTDQGKQMKSTAGWSTNENGTNTSGFTAIPNGYRYYQNGGFNGIGILGYWWTGTQADATTAYYRRLDGSNNDVYRASALKKAGKYVRCVKN
jgi:uncharacterized protein (TIGR02145 family)